jgi:non-specific serine/threonine protein kinase
MSVAYTFGRFELKPATRQLLVGGQPANLGARAFDLLLALVERRDRLVTKDELLDLAWPGLVVEENNLHVQVSFLRKILGDGIIETVAGKGYRFAAQATASERALDLLATPRNNLPHPLTRFVGHEIDLDEYESIVGNNRLITLTGVGGCGKTRLAIELASRLLRRFAYGAWFVDLAPMADGERLPLTVARTIGLKERSGQPVVEALCEFVAGREMLLVLDNCEHLMTACEALVATMLDRGDGLHVLATSRQALGLQGEQTLRVRSLSCPTSTENASPARAEMFEAVQLFVDRARLVQPGFRLNASTTPTVVEICRQLDGVPLAIELAAARIKVLSVAELRRKLDDRFALLVGGSRAAPPRQQTLLATIKWSFDLLTEQEHCLLLCLSVFSGGWTLEGAIAVSGASSEYEVLDVLTHLIEKSLISSHSDSHGDTRYSMLETVRQYAASSLAKSQDRGPAIRRHLDYVVRLAERLEPEFIGSRQREVTEKLAPDLENIVLALKRCDQLPDTSELALRLAGALSQFWVSVGLLKLGYDLTTQVLSRSKLADASLPLARALFVATRLAIMTERFDASEAWGQQCLAVAQSVGDHHCAAGALAFLANAAIMRDDLAAAIDYGEAAVRLARERNDDEHLGRALNILADAQRRSGKLQAARALFQESLERARARGDFHAIVALAANLGETYLVEGEFGEARPLVTEALAASVGNKSTMQVAVELVAVLAAATNDWRSAACMWGAVTTANKASGVWSPFATLAVFAPFLAAMKASHEHPDLQTAFDAGAAMTLDEALLEARTWLERGTPSEHGAAPR